MSEIVSKAFWQSLKPEPGHVRRLNSLSKNCRQVSEILLTFHYWLRRASHSWRFFKSSVQHIIWIMLSFIRPRAKLKVPQRVLRVMRRSAWIMRPSALIIRCSAWRIRRIIWIKCHVVHDERHIIHAEPERRIFWFFRTSHESCRTFWTFQICTGV